MKEIKLHTSFHKTTSRGNKQESKAYSLTDITKWLSHNERLYQEKSKYLFSKINLENSYRNQNFRIDQSFKDWFNDQIPGVVLRAYNSKQRRADRKINDYFEHITSKSSQQSAIAEQLILQLGSEKELLLLAQKTPREEWDALWKTWHKEALEFLEQVLPEFKIYSSNLHLDETSPHLHIIGTGFQEAKDAKKGLAFRLASSNIFTKERIERLHQELRTFNQTQANRLTALAKKYKIGLDKQDELALNGEEIIFKSAQNNKVKDLGIHSASANRFLENLSAISREDKIKVFENLGVDLYYKKDEKDKTSFKDHGLYFQKGAHFFKEEFIKRELKTEREQLETTIRKEIEANKGELEKENASLRNRAKSFEAEVRSLEFKNEKLEQEISKLAYEPVELRREQRALVSHLLKNEILSPEKIEELSFKNEFKNSKNIFLEEAKTQRAKKAQNSNFMPKNRF